MKWLDDQRKIYNKIISDHYERIAYWTDKIVEAENQDKCNHEWTCIPKRKADTWNFDPGEEAYIRCAKCDLVIHSDTEYEDHKKIFEENYKL